MADPNRRVLHARLAQRPIGQPNHLGIDKRAGRAEQFDADLVEFAQTGVIKISFAAKDGTGDADSPRENRGLFKRGVGANDAGGQFGSQAERTI